MLIVADDKDPHSNAVAEVLRGRSVPVVQCNLSTLAEHAFTWDSGDSYPYLDGIGLADGSRIWLRRIGRYRSALEAEEAQLVSAEAREAFLGALLSSPAEWIDHPVKVALAESKIYQLETARRLGLSIPPYIITNDWDRARAFLGQRQAITKALSAGPGLAPHADVVDLGLLESAPEGPYFLQELVIAEADLRVITVGPQVFVWSRTREGGSSIDWRVDDPTGAGFKRAVAESELSSNALQLARRLGLQFTVQDWLFTKRGPVFLELNPQGEWLFLEGAKASVVPTLASLLTTEDYQNALEGGRYPSPFLRFWWDILPSKLAPPSDGLAPPRIAVPQWLDVFSSNSEVHEFVHAARERAEERASLPIEKAARLISLNLTFLTLSLALAAFQVDQLVGSSRGWWWIAAPPTAGAILCFSVAVIMGMDVDRPGLQYNPPMRRLLNSSEPFAIARLRFEEQARVTADWTARYRFQSFLSARAWFSRGLVLLLISTVVVICLRTFSVS